MLGELLAEAVDVVDGVVHGDADRDRGDGDGHHVQRNTRKPHQPEHGGGGEQVGNDADDGEPGGSEEEEEHDRDADRDRSQGRDLRRVQAL